MSLGKMTIYHTHDETDCETCGASWEEAYEIKFNGGVYGTQASASCFGSKGNTLLGALVEVFSDYGCIDIDAFDDVPWLETKEALNVLRRLGFTVEYDSDEY